MLFGDLIIRNARRYPNKDGIICGKERFTWSQVNARVNKLVRGLRGLGVKKGDRVAILSNNCHQYLECYCAGGKSGIITVPLNYRLVGRELVYILNNSEANSLIIGPEYITTVKPILNELNYIKNKILLTGSEEDFLNYEELLSGRILGRNRVRIGRARSLLDYVYERYDRASKGGYDNP